VSFPWDLLEQAHDLVLRDLKNPKQATLRRAVSTAYYALFHLLIDEAVGKWAVQRQRSKLARNFKHQEMKKTCERVLLEKAKGGANIPAELITVAQSFVKLQQNRETADYDNSKVWSVDEALEPLDLASSAFTAWDEVGSRAEAEDFLLELFLPKLPAQ